MHPRNPYQTPLDFENLAESFPPLSVHLLKTQDGRPVIDFKSVEAQRRLTEALLHRDFGLKLSVPAGRLCPAVPNRLNYILWIQDLIQASVRYDELRPERTIGIDIGIGASAIYPLLACKLEPNWEFIGTEIDELSQQSALKNISQNELSSRIRVVKTSEHDPILLPLFQDDGVMYTFTMCNPPFYSSSDDVERSAEGKAFEPNGVCTGSDNEMIVEGGEAAFVRRIVDESVNVSTRCRWFTSMLGKLSSVTEVVQALRTHKVDNYAITELIQGQTRRWVIAWSFTDIRLPDSLARPTSDSLRQFLPLPNELQQPYQPTLDHISIRSALEGVLKNIDGVTFTELDSKDSPTSSPLWELLVKASRNSWSRSERRKKNAGNAATESKTIAGIPALSCTIREVSPLGPSSTIDGKSKLVLQCSWVRGRDRGLFESFWSHVSRKVGVALGGQS
ncbi:hypothetical protein SCHPADRAFT_624344 [Schizopora paradoxa]|uniref:S-adenosyl-L-methionine dependent methyltransferase n=1 Tax=Schizopora paradoxa TaxID=27342 RepID=A0A0H2R9H7_9AGAM|nr:hypothetical protein SCHPADRAFT_624344 [Schizopora paradoxa]